MSDGDFVSTGRHTTKFKATRIGKENPYKPSRVIDSENLNTCLTCDKPKCRGFCEKIKKENTDGRTQP